MEGEFKTRSESVVYCENGSFDRSESGGRLMFSHSKPSDSDTSSISSVSFFVLVARRGDLILMRRERDRFCCCHQIDVQNSPYEGAHLLRKEICTFFGISSNTYITAEITLSDLENDSYHILTVLEVTDDRCEVVHPFEWIDWRSCEIAFGDACPYPQIARFLKPYLSNMDVEEINLKPTPWRRVGFYGFVLPRIQELMPDVGYEMPCKPEQIHFGSLSTIFKIPTNEGLIFFKAGFKGNGEPLKTKAITSLLPDNTPRLLGVDVDLEFMLSEDHGPSVHNLYIDKSNEMPNMEEKEIRSLFSSALLQWAGVQKGSIAWVPELIENGIPLYDKAWIRAGFSELISYMKDAELDREYEQVCGFEKNMELTFDAWDHFKVPNMLVHGDLHNSNIAQPGGLGTKFIFFDWDSAFVGHPFLELWCDETQEISYGEDAYLGCWKEYGEFEELKRLAAWTRPVRYVIEAVREGRKEIWTDRERRMWVQDHLDMMVDCLDNCDYDEQIIVQKT